MADEELGRAIIKIGADDAELDRSISNAENKAKGFAQSLAESLSNAITTAVTGAVAAASAALTGLAVTGVNAFAGFQEQMNSVFTLLPGISQQAMQEMGAQVKDFAVEFGALPEKVIPALYEALSSGVPKDNVFSFLATAQKAAIGGVTDTQTTVDGLTSVVNAYGADVLSVQDASDQMFTAVAYGKTTFAEMAGTLYNVNPIAASLGVAFSDLSAAIAAMTAQGVPTAQTTTMLRQLFVELSQSGGEVSDLFQQLSGTSFKSFIANGGNVQQALQLLEQHANSSGVGINDLFSSVEAGSAALTLTGRGTEMFTGALESMQNSAGATEAAYQQMDQGLARSFDYLKAEFKVLQTDVGNALAPTVQAFADWLHEAMPRISAVVVGAFERIGSAVQTVGPYFAQFASTASEAFGLFIDLAGSAIQWGSNIATQLANGIMGGAGAVVDSLNYIGDLVTYWLEPHSPPKLLPNIDTWGRDTAQVWMDGWNDARLPTDGLLAYLENELKSIEDAQQRVKEAAQEKQLLAMINSTGGKDSDREQAKLELAALKLRQKIREEQAKAAEQEVKKTKATGGGGGGGGKSPMDDAAKKAEAAARAQWEYNFSVAGTADRLQMLKDRQAGYATTDAEYWRLQGQINQEEQKRQAELDKLAKEQREYELSLMSTEDQLARLRQEQSQYAEGSEAYNAIQKDINKAEQQRQRELDEVKRKQEEAAKAERDYQYATADTAGKLAILQGELANTNADQSEYWRIKTQISQLEAQQQKELEASAEKMKGVGGAAKGAAKGVGALIPPLGGIKDKAEEANQALNDASNGASAAADRYTDLKERQQEMANAAAPVPSLIDRIRSAFTQAAPFIDLVKGALGGIATLFVGMQLVSLFQGLGLAVAALVSPMGLLVAGAAALGLAWQTNFGNIRTITTEVFGSIQTTVQTAWGIITSWFRENGEQVVTFLRDAWGRIEGIVSTVLGAVGTVIQTALGAIRTFLQEHGEEIKGTLSMAWETIQTVINGALDIIDGAIVPAFQGIATFIGEHKDQITGVLSGAWSIIKGIVEAAMSVIQGVIKTVSAVIKGDWSGAWTAIKDMFAGIWNGIVDVVTGALEGIWNLLVIAWDLIGTGISTAWDGISGYFSTMFGGVLDNLSGFLTKFKDMIGGAWDWVKKACDWLWENISGGMVKSFSGILTDLKKPINAVIWAVNKLIEGANAVSSSLGMGTIPLIPSLAEGARNWAGGLAFASEPWLGVEAMRTPGGDFALLPPGVSDIPRGAEVFTAEETRGMAARMRVPQGGMLGAHGMEGSGGTTIVNYYTYEIAVDAREAMNPAAVEAAGYRGAQKAIKEQTEKANMRKKTNPFGK